MTKLYIDTNVIRDMIEDRKNFFGGRRATNVLRGLIGGKQVSITPVGNSYNRVVAHVRKGRKSINKRMREKGY